MLLETQNLTKRFGGLVAVKDVSFNIKRGEIVGLIGPNGAGKTTIFNLIVGFYKPESGLVKFKGENIIGLQPFQVLRKGIGRTFQIPKPLSELSVLDNVTIGVLKGHIKDLNKVKGKAMEVLEFMGLAAKRDVLSRTLTLAERKRLELARVLATEPELLLLDEIVAGLNPVEVENIIALIKKLRDEGITLLIIEHVMRAVMSISDRVIVLHHGEKIAEGPPKSIVKDEEVIKAYLGEEYLIA